MYTLIYVFIRQTSTLSPLAGYFPLIGEAGLDILAAYFCLLGWRTTNYNMFSTYLPMALSFLMAALADGIYNIGLNLYGNTYNNLSYTLCFEIPFLIFLVLQLVVWIKVFIENTRQYVERKSMLILPFILLAGLLSSLFMFGVNWKIGYFSQTGKIQLIDTIVEVLGFAFSSITLARCKTKHICFLSLGFLLIISSDLIIRYNVVSGITPYLSIFECTWVLGLALICLGLWDYRIGEDIFTLSPLNNLKTQISIWLLVLLFSSFFILIFCYAFFHFPTGNIDDIYLLCLTLFIPVTTIVITASTYIASMILSPLHNIDRIIRIFIKSPESYRDEENTIKYDKIEEFRLIETFVRGSFSEYSKSAALQKKMSDLVSQVSHDLRSPLIALNIMTDAIKDDISDEKLGIIKSCVSQIYSIADDLLAYKRRLAVDSDGAVNSKKLTNNYLIELLTGTFNQKIIEYKGSLVKFMLNIETVNDIFDVMLDPIALKRVISNLINNAVEATAEGGLVTLDYNFISDKIVIDVTDTGCGFPDSAILAVENKIKSTKPNGNGLGLLHAIEFITKNRGKYEVINRSQGAIFRMIFPAYIAET